MPSTSSKPGETMPAPLRPDGGAFQDADEFGAFITMCLASHPEWLPSALTSISRGMASAIDRIEKRAALKDQATLAVMVLSQGRIGKDLRETLLARVAAAIHPINQCNAERGYIDQYAAIARAEPQP